MSRFFLFPSFCLLLSLATAPIKVHGESHCRPSAETCDYYQCIEAQVHCGHTGYPLHFGDRQCKKYLLHEPRSSVHLQNWYPQIRLCLQDALDEILKNENAPNDCRELSRAAFASHVDCYVNNGYCDLNWSDKAQILRAAGLSVFSPSSIQTGLDIEKACQNL